MCPSRARDAAFSGRTGSEPHSRDELCSPVGDNWQGIPAGLGALPIVRSWESQACAAALAALRASAPISEPPRSFGGPVCWLSRLA
jgi:hypothetical protein